MKIFVSYARVDKPCCIRVIETLHAHDVWYDQRLYAGQDWWKEILRRLDWCDVFIYLLSPDSVASLYCRQELEIARRLQRDIIPALINRETVLPDDMKDWQYVDLADSLNAENVAQLLNSILLVERQKTAAPPAALSAAEQEESPVAFSSPVELIRSAAQSLEKGDFDHAILLLKQAQANGYQSRFVKLDKLLNIAESAVAERTKQREVQREYQHIVALFAFESTRRLACEAFAEFTKAYGNYDPRGLRRYCESRQRAGISSPNSRSSDVVSVSQPNSRIDAASPVSEEIGAASLSRVSSNTEQPAASPISEGSQRGKRKPGNSLMAQEILPMLQWCEIPYGNVTIASIEGADEDFGEMTVQVDNFVMSKFPVTNAQFDIFARAEDGCKNPRWWSFSEHARRWFKLGKGVSRSRFDGDERPRENVNWYEAMAFANWLSSLLKMKITLPTVAQWQRAAKGDDDRYFPWGDDYHEEYCNTRESGLKMTTPVNRYAKGISPYGVYDMAGNIWEWTMNTAASDEGRDFRRAVAGGSFVSTCDRVQTSFRYYLDPRVRYSSIGIRLVGLT